MNMFVKAPAGLLAAPFHERSLQLADATVVESCTHFRESNGSLYLQNHLLLFVLSGAYTIRHGGQTYVVEAGEMVLLQRAIQLDYHKTGDAANGFLFDALMFFLQDELVKDFVQRAHPRLPRASQREPVAVRPVSPTIRGFLESVKPYFDDPAQVDRGLLRLKMLELLYDLSASAPGLLQQLLQLQQPLRANIATIVEDNAGTGVALPDLAYLAGRSLSSFKRDFQAIYHVPPAQWLRARRLDRARALLSTTDASVTDVCYELGFESVAHFSRLFKRHFGYVPSSLKPASVAAAK